MTIRSSHEIQHELSIQYANWMAQLRESGSTELEKAVALDLDRPLPDDYHTRGGATELQVERMVERPAPKIGSDPVPRWAYLVMELIEMENPLAALGMILIGAKHPAAPALDALLKRAKISRQKAAAVAKAVRRLGFPSADDAPFSRDEVATLDVIHWVVGRRSTRLSLLIALRAAGIQAGGEATLEEIGKRFGVTKANVAREVAEMQRHFNLKRSRFQKSEEQSKVYKFSNCTPFVGQT